MKSVAALALVALPFALASPYHMQQHAERNVVVDWVTDTAVVTVYAEVTQYATGPAPPGSTTVTVAAPSSSSSLDIANKQEHHWTWSGQNGQGHWSHTAESTSTEAPAPAPTTSSSEVYVPPTTIVETSAAPEPTTSTEPAFTPPVVVPTTTEAPVITQAPITTQAPATTEAPATTAAPSPAQYANTGPGPYLIPAASSTFSADVGAKTGAPGYAIDTGAMQAALLNSTNVWRSMFQAAPLAWDYDLQAKAQNNANGCQFEHDSAGQNLAAGYSGPESANDGWAGEYTSYNFANPDFSEDSGHFTQVVWQDTTHIGCAAVNCGSNNPAQGW